MFDTTVNDSDACAASPIKATPEGLCVFSPAKINLNLLVGPLRPDGFHPVDSCVAKISMYDQIHLQPRQDGTISLACEGISCGPMEENLAYRAAALLAEGRDVPGADIRLMKTVPPGGGLGGGSSDAAGVVAGLNKLWGLELPRNELMTLAAGLGSDVSLFLGPAASRATGRGETLESIDVFDFRAVLILPGLHCSTQEVYQTFDANPATPMKQLDTALLTRPPSQWRDRLENHLAEPACTVCPALGEFHQRLSDILPSPVCLSGSGSSLFVLCDDQAEAQRIMDAIPSDVRGLCKIVRKNPW